MNKIAVIIPAFNEAENLSALIGEIGSLRQSFSPPLDAVIVNDHSTDRTLEVASRHNGAVIDLPINLGIGGAVQTGIKYALENGYAYALQVDGDGQHPPSEIPKLVRAMEESQADLVIGSRFIRGAGFKSTISRRIGIKYFSFLIKLFSGQRIADCTSGFRLFNRRAMELAAEYYPDQYPEPESIIRFSRRGLKIFETPVLMRPRQGGESSIRPMGALYYTIKVTLAMLFGGIKGWKT